MNVAFVARVALIVSVAAFLAAPSIFEPLLRSLAPEGAPVIYRHANLAELTALHLGLTALALAASALVGVILAISVTQPWGREFLPLSRSLANAGQTFPPVAVLAIAVPAVGFGAEPTLIALIIYGILPVFENALAGLGRAPARALEAADACGMTRAQRLRKVELPLALPAILAGLRLAAISGVATATIGSAVAARTLGEVVFAGLASNNLAYVVQGAGLIAALAILISDALLAMERKAAEAFPV
ncbi:ABC transporter permease [Hansschlegelia quercus]|uniref:ABC transporter permease n=1 Tax=Hansschlegelia quercus TaxID=2528245 RepID=A0A4Q9GKB9_9HYPH|nr:ABC transporter permease [Hansschlegelia quercus]TBN54733.1 ABC transporter permease [Hansschlegelia quercus]